MGLTSSVWAESVVSVILLGFPWAWWATAGPIFSVFGLLWASGVFLGLMWFRNIRYVFRSVYLVLTKFVGLGICRAGPMNPFSKS